LLQQLQLLEMLSLQELLTRPWYILILPLQLLPL
jgi:hypothetical protein